MENLKNINISEEQLMKCRNLAMEPAFAIALKRIDDFIEQAKSGKMSYIDYDVVVNDDSVTINVAYSFFNKEDIESGKAKDKNNRSITSFKMSLDDEKNFVMLKEKGSFYQVEARKVKAKYDFERTVVKKGTETVIEKDCVYSPLDNEKNILAVYIPFNANGLTSLGYKACDDELKIQLEARAPKMEKGVIDFNDRNYRSLEHYSAYSAVRDESDLSKASVKEFLHYPNGLEIETKKEHGSFVNMSDPDVMRIDSPYGPSSYTVEQINNIEQKKQMVNQETLNNESLNSNGKTY